jgi:hypothetical protein
MVKEKDPNLSSAKDVSKTRKNEQNPTAGLNIQVKEFFIHVFILTIYSMVLEFCQYLLSWFSRPLCSRAFSLRDVTK